MLCNYSFMIYYCNMILLYILPYILILLLYVHLLLIFPLFYLAVHPNEKQGTSPPGVNLSAKCMVSTIVKIENENRKRNFAKEKIFENVFCELESRELEIENEKIKKSRFQPYACMCA